MALGGISDAGRDSYLSSILVLIFVIPLFYVYSKPFLVYEKLDYFQIMEKVYGKNISKVINFVIALSVLFVAVISFSRFSLFIKTVALSKTSLNVIGIFMVITCIYAVYNGLSTIARFCEILIYAIGFFLVLSTIISFSAFKPENMTPFLENGFKPVIQGMFSILAVPYLECFALITLVFSTRKRKDMPKTIYIALIVSAICMAIIFLRNLLILGYPAIESLYYPSYISISLVKLGEFFQRQEVAVSIIFLIADILKISVLSLYLCKYLNFTLKTYEQKHYSVAVILFVFTLSNIFFTNTITLFDFFDIYKYFLVIPFIIIPIMTYFIIIFKKTTA